MLSQKIKSWLPDALLIAGAAAMTYGSWLCYAPAGFLVGGALTLYAGLRLSAADERSAAAAE